MDIAYKCNRNNAITQQKMLQKKYCYKAIKSAKPHFWASFRYCKSASILGETDSPQIANPKNCMINFIGRAQSSKFLQNSAQLCHKHKTALKVVFLKVNNLKWGALCRSMSPNFNVPNINVLHINGSLLQP